MAAGSEPNEPMTPREYVEAIVLPTLHEFLAARDDRRRAYLACLVICHVADSLGLAEITGKPEFAAMLKNARKKAVEAATKDAQEKALIRCGSAFTVVLGMANGTKHPDRQPLMPGREEAIPAFAFDMPSAGLDVGRLDVPGLLLRDGEKGLFLDVCAQLALAAFVQAYPAHLGEISLGSFMDPGLEVLELTVEPAWLTEIIGWAASKPDAEELWVSKTAANGPSDVGTELVIKVMLTESKLQAVGGLMRCWEAEGFADLYKQWRSELAAIIGQDVRLGLLGEPDGLAAQGSNPSQASPGPRTIRLWTRPEPDDSDLVSLPAR